MARLNIIFLLSLFSLFSYSQTYTNAIGVRGGTPSGITFKHFMGSANAIEGIVSFWPYGLGVTALYEKHAAAFGIEGLNWFYGPGAHLQLYSNAGHPAWSKRDATDGIGLGIDGILGMEYKIEPIPFTIGLDLKPNLEFTSFGGVYFDISPGLSIRYTF